MWRIASMTSLFVALVMTFFLKVLQLFSWIDWHPTTFLKKDINNDVLRWVILAFLVYLCALGLYTLLQYVYKWPRYITGFVLGVVMGGLLEWWILDLPFERGSFKALSIPFIVVVVTMLLFIVETATFHRENFVGRKNLPYKKTVLK